LGLPVVVQFPNDYVGVNKAMTAGKWMEPDTEMGVMFADFAKSLIDKKPVAKEPKKFLEFLNTPNRLLAPQK